MKNKLFLFLFIAAFATLPAFSQDMEKDTIQLNEAIVGKKHKPKRVTYKFRRGTCTVHESLNRNTEFASMATDFPKGKLKSLRFNFNNPFYQKDYIYYKDTQVELIFYEVGADGFPGNKIASKTFTVPGEHRGAMDIDVSDLGVHNDKGIYIALSRLTKDAEPGKNEFEVDCTCAENNSYKMVARNPNDGSWKLEQGEYISYAFRLTVTVEQ